MNGGKGHRRVEGLVLERKALRDASRAPRPARRTLRAHDGRASASAAHTCAAILGSVRRVTV